MTSIQTIVPRHILLACTLLGAGAGACDWGPKNIGDETASSGDSETDGGACQDGDEKPSEDGCNTCFCSDGEWGCTLKACAETTGGDECVDGDQMPAGDGCNTCTCYEGTWACTEIGCEPQCEDGQEKMEGCNQCECADGQWACTDKACEPECKDGEEKMDGCNECICYEGGWACTDKACPQGCGDGIVEPDLGEQCDDGNQVDGDGCSANCTTENAACGDGVLNGGEQCDDGNGVDGDGCSANCTLEGGACGDGIVQGAEQCDDGNASDGDGCSANCTLEGGGAIEICQDQQASDAYNIVDAKIDGDALIVGVEFGGGCEEHLFTYCWDGAFLESDPVQVHTEIVHESNDDPCDAWLSQTLSLDLVPLKTAWQEGYQQQSGEIILHLEGTDSLLYSF